VNYVIDLKQPSTTELRVKVGWNDTDLAMIKRSLENSLFHVTARTESKLIGMGRIIGDGAMFYYIQDVVIDPEYQHQGLGNALMLEIEQFLSINAKKGATVALLSAQGKEKFYSRYGYLERSGDPLGKGMCKFI
jgi:ribosomal protein S18 acetylase RimI-like enzyme